MARRKKQKQPRPIFDSIRKPVAPPTQKIGSQKPEEKIHPSERKSKHKKKVEIDD